MDQTGTKLHSLSPKVHVSAKDTSPGIHKVLVFCKLTLLLLHRRQELRCKKDTVFVCYGWCNESCLLKHIRGTFPILKFRGNRNNCEQGPEISSIKANNCLLLSDFSLGIGYWPLVGNTTAFNVLEWIWELTPSVGCKYPALQWRAHHLRFAPLSSHTTH